MVSSQVEVPDATGPEAEAEVDGHVLVEEAGIEDLVVDVVGQVGIPVDVWAVAATLESYGMRDVDALRYGEQDIFALAERVHAECRLRLASQVPTRRELTPVPLKDQLRRFGHFYARGALFALPMVVQTLSVLVLGFALWSYLRFDLRAASVVSIGTIWSFVVTGGFVQAIGRLGRYYLEQKAFVLARDICWRLVRLGAIATIALGLPFPFAVYAGWIPPGVALQAGAYYHLLAVLWLTLAILYTLQRQLLIVGCISAGIAVIWVVRSWTDWNIYLAHWVALALTVALSGGLAWRSLRSLSAQVTGTALLSTLPRQALIAYLVSPYFLYGVLYFGFLFLDRVIGWTEGVDPLFIWFDTPYEIGLDIALLSMVFTLAQLEYTIHEFSASVVQVQASFDADSIPAHNRWFKRFYLRQVAVLAALSALSIWLVLVVVVRIGGRFDTLADVVDNPVMRSVYWFGAVGYALLVFALMNGVFFFSLSRVSFVLRGLGLAIVVNVLVGTLLSRHFEYWHSVVGLTAGALVFAVVTGLYGIRVLRRMDYYYYSAF